MNSFYGKAGNKARFIGAKHDSRSSSPAGINARRRVLWFGIVSPLVCAGVSAHAQESLRMSIASAEAAEARREAMELDYCNLKWKSVTARIDAGVGMIYQDNVFYSSTNAQGDFALRPSLTVKALIPVTDLNSLYFSTGIGYLQYTRFNTLDSFYITPDSMLQFLIYSGDFVINVHDRFSLTENGAQTPSISSANNMGRMENTAGVGADWDQNKLILSAGADYKLTQYSFADFDYMNHDDVLLTSTASYEVTRTIRSGLEAGGGVINYSQKDFSDKIEYHGGPFIDAKLSDYFTTRLSGGYVNYDLQSGKTIEGESNVDSYYARWSLRNRLTRFYTHQLELSHTLNLGSYYELEKLYAVSYRGTYRLTSKVTLFGGAQYQTGQNYYPTSKWDVDWVSADINAEYRWTRKLRTSAGYLYANRDSTRAKSSYAQNRLALSLTYTF